MGKRGIEPRYRTCPSSSPKNAKLAFTSSSVTFKYVELKPAMAPGASPRVRQRVMTGRNSDECAEPRVCDANANRDEREPAVGRAHLFDIDLVRRRWDVRVERVGDPHLQSRTLHSHTNDMHSLRARPLTAASMGTDAAVIGIAHHATGIGLSADRALSPCGL
jgi:hypothetical protein